MSLKTLNRPNADAPAGMTDAKTADDSFIGRLRGIKRQLGGILLMTNNTYHALVGSCQSTAKESGPEAIHTVKILLEEIEETTALITDMLSQVNSCVGTPN